MLRSHRRLTLALCSLIASSMTGCALVDLIDGDPVALVRFFGAHAGTPDEDGYPFYGDEQTTRVFENDTGWLISMSEVFVTTAEVHFVRCDNESSTSIEMFWGPCPESYTRANDVESIPFGSVTVNDGLYCAIDITFGPYVPPVGGDEHVAVGSQAILDNTVVVIGTARRGEAPNEEIVAFEIISDATLEARVDVSSLELGQPVKLEDEDFPRDLTIVKIYDHFFDGIDFSVATQAELEASVLAAIERDLVVHDGTYD